jgi:prepilin-type N-terminal cleavage/methylation domain-containing protein
MSMISRDTLRHRTRSRGFSLIELAIGLVIVATLLSALLVPLATQMDQQRAAETRRQLETARDALMGFATSHGRLPCPATDLSNGVEAFLPPTGSAANGQCASAHGFLPGVTLGLSPLDGNGYYRDAYGTLSNRIRYAVSLSNVDRYSNSVDCATRTIPPGTPAVAIIRPLTTSPSAGAGMRAATMQAIAQAATCDNFFFTVCTTGANCTGAGNQTLSNGGAMVVVWSLGRNAGDTGRTTPADELENQDNDNFFVLRDRRDRREDADNEFDDYVLWISPSLLLARMAAAGALP